MADSSSHTAARVKTAVLRVDSGLALPGENGPLRVAVEVRVPMTLTDPAIALVCLPGGGMSRRYFDLMPEDGDTSFSFAEQMTARGFIVVLIDHLGLGESDKPKNGWALTPEVLSQANAAAVAEVTQRLRAGSLMPDCLAFPELVTIGVGHSMGALLTLVQQANHSQHAGLAILGFSCEGLPAYLSDAAKALIGQPEIFRAQLAEMARAQFGDQAYAVIKPSKPSGSLFAADQAEMKGMLVIRSAADKLLALGATLAMFPGNVAPEAAAISVPLFIGVGELDLAGSAHKISASFTSCKDLTLHVLPKAGHSHFLFPARHGLYDRLAGWARSYVLEPSPSGRGAKTCFAGEGGQIDRALD